MSLESAAGLALIGAAAAAIVLDNSPAGAVYDAILNLRGVVSIDQFSISKPLLLWINDGLMAVFFLLVGLEIKREALEGEMSTPGQIVLPALAALGGMALPAAIYAAVNWSDPLALRGWAIPAATDIAFALGILSLTRSLVPVSLKLFLTAVAIFDDLGAIVIIALFYTADLSVSALVLAALALLMLLVLNRLAVTRLAPYVVVGVVLWVLVLKSGVHATLTGVALACAIPLRAKDSHGLSPLHHLEDALHPWVAFMILPMFAFANAGLPLSALSPMAILEPVPLGVALSLFAGKQLGVFGAAWLAIRSGLARLPTGATWPQFYGVCVLTGIGFTMSLFIGTLAFDDPAPINGVRSGVLWASLLSAICGIGVILFAGRKRVLGVEGG